MRSLIESYKILFSFLFFMSVIGAAVALAIGGFFLLAYVCDQIETNYGQTLAVITFLTLGINVFILPLLVYVNKEV